MYKGLELQFCDKYGFDRVGDSFVDSPNVEMRIKIARAGYGLDKLINDSDERVRAEVAKHEYKPEVMINDSSSLVKRALLENGIGFEKFISDSDKEIASLAEEVRNKILL